MELDKRIEKLSDILTCFDVQKAGQFLGQDGYFSDCFDHYRCLANRKYGILTEIKDSDCPFKEGNNEYYRFFIPKLVLKPKSKKYRPYSITEFCLQFTIGKPITLRRKGNKAITHYIMFVGYDYMREDSAGSKILLGNTGYSLKELFEEYEWQVTDSIEFKPFGVEE